MRFNAQRFKARLKLAIGRLKHLQAKTDASGKQQAFQLAELLARRKVESARLRVELLIREDLKVEAMELVLLYCELMLDNVGVLEEKTSCNHAIMEAASTIIYAAPRLNVQELNHVRDMLAMRFGKDFTAAALENWYDEVNPRIMSKLKVDLPSAELVDEYLEEIAKAYNINWSAPPLHAPPAGNGPCNRHVGSQFQTTSSASSSLSSSQPSTPSNASLHVPPGGHGHRACFSTSGTGARLPPSGFELPHRHATVGPCPGVTYYPPPCGWDIPRAPGIYPGTGGEP